ncbi:MAG TPA: hypothetical protein VLC95_16795 [Anaerolineae bacterium]|nr:hypothetical protein [Anaerolineae bacterium]
MIPIPLPLEDRAESVALQPGEELLLGPGESREFFVRITPSGEPQLVGDMHSLDVLPYGNGQALLVDGLQSGVRYLLEPLRIYLPLVVRASSAP